MFLVFLVSLLCPLGLFPFNLFVRSRLGQWSPKAAVILRQEMGQGFYHKPFLVKNFTGGFQPEINLRPLNQSSPVLVIIKAVSPGDWSVLTEHCLLFVVSLMAAY